MDHLIIKPFDLLIVIPWTMVAYLWQNSCQFFFHVLFLYIHVFSEICAYENYIHMRIICMSEIYAC